MNRPTLFEDMGIVIKKQMEIGGDRETGRVKKRDEGKGNRYGGETGKEKGRRWSRMKRSGGGDDGR